MTYDLYCRILPEAEQKAISFLPDFGNLFGENRLCVSLCKPVENDAIPVDTCGHEKRYNGSKQPFGLHKTMLGRGLEPPWAEAHQPLKLARLPIPPPERCQRGDNTGKTD